MSDWSAALLQLLSMATNFVAALLGDRWRRISLIALSILIFIVVILISIGHVHDWGYKEGAIAERTVVEQTRTAQPTPISVQMATRPPPTSTPEPTALPTDIPIDMVIAIDTAQNANTELANAFQNVNTTWTANQLKHWCNNMLSDLNDARNRRRAQFQPKDGKITATYVTTALKPPKRTGSNSQLLYQTDQWTYAWTLLPNALKTSPSSFSAAATEYVFGILSQSDGKNDKNCISSYYSNVQSVIVPPATRTLTPTASATLENTPLKKGVSVRSIIPDAAPKFNNDVKFKVEFENSSGVTKHLKWFVQIFNPKSESGLDKSVGQTTQVENDIPPGTIIVTSGSWKIGPGDRDYKAEVYEVGSTKGVTTTVGTRAIFDFSFQP